MIEESLCSEGPLDSMELCELISMLQQYLQEIGVSGTAVDKVVETCMLRQIHAKLSGGGGDGGCCLAVYVKSPDFDLAGLTAELSSHGASVLQVSKESDGLQFH